MGRYPSGRGNTRSGRGGRGHTRPGRGSSRTKSQPTDYKDMKFTPSIPGKPQVYTYSTVKEHVIQIIQKSFKSSEDIAKALKDLQEVDFTSNRPVRSVSTLSERGAKQIEQDGFNIDYQEALRLHLQRESDYWTNKYKAYSLIFEQYCSKAMKSRVEEHIEFQSRINDNPIALLEVLKTLTHDPVRARYTFASMTEALVNCVNVRQFEDENWEFRPLRVSDRSVLEETSVWDSRRTFAPYLCAVPVLYTKFSLCSDKRLVISRWC